MKKLGLLLVVVKTAFIFSQAPSLQWQKSIGGSGIDKANCVKQTTDGGYIVAGFTASTDGDVIGGLGGNDFLIVKLDATGTIVWKKIYGGTGSEGASSITQTTDGGYIVSGGTGSADGDVIGQHGGTDVWILKLDASGNIVWKKTYGGTGTESASSIKETTDGGYIISANCTFSNGEVTGTYAGGDIWVVKINVIGTIIWTKILGGNDLDFADDMQLTSDGGYIIAGNSASTDGNVTGNHGITDYWIVKLNATGGIVWQKSLGGSSTERAYSIAITSDGGYIVAGSSTSSNGDVTGAHGSNDYWIVKLNATGGIVWQKSLGGTAIDLARSIFQDSDGGYIVAGYTTSTDGDVASIHGDRDCWILKLNATGGILWQKSLGGSGFEESYNINKTNDGYYIIAGNASSIDGDVTGNHGNADYWIVKLGPALATNTFTSNTIKVFPNPVNNILTVKIDYFIPSQEITITDILGKTIHTQKTDGLINTINTSNLQKGIYFLNILEGAQKITKSFIKE